MSTISTLSGNVAAPVNFVLMRGLLTQARKVLPFFNGTMPGNLQKNGGSTSVKWRRFDDLAVATTALGEKSGNVAFGMGRTAAVPSITDLTVAIAKYGNYINYTEELDLFNVNSRAAQILDVLGRNAGESLNVLMSTVFDGSVNARFAGGVASISVAVTAISGNDIKYTVNQLNRQSAMKFFSMGTSSQNVGNNPVRSSYFGICHPDVEEDVRGLTGFIGVETYGGYIGDVQVGEFGHVNGVRWVSTPICPIVTAVGSGSNSANGMVNGGSVATNIIFKSFIYGREAVGSVGLGEDHTEEIYLMGDRPPAIELINKPVGSSGVADPFNEIGSLAWKAWFAGKILNQAWLWEVDTLATAL
jgi:N4-gp56 family major capsid protein